MCRPVGCTVCGKTTWAGCGQHIAQVRAGVAPDQWCNGSHTDAERAAAPRQGGLLRRLFGR